MISCGQFYALKNGDVIHYNTRHDGCIGVVVAKISRSEIIVQITKSLSNCFDDYGWRGRHALPFCQSYYNFDPDAVYFILSDYQHHNISLDVSPEHKLQAKMLVASRSFIKVPVFSNTEGNVFPDEDAFPLVDEDNDVDDYDPDDDYISEDDDSY